MAQHLETEATNVRDSERSPERITHLELIEGGKEATGPRPQPREPRRLFRVFSGCVSIEEFSIRHGQLATPESIVLPLKFRPSAVARDVEILLGDRTTPVVRGKAILRPHDLGSDDTTPGSHTCLHFIELDERSRLLLEEMCALRDQDELTEVWSRSEWRRSSLPLQPPAAADDDEVEEAEIDEITCVNPRPLPPIPPPVEGFDDDDESAVAAAKPAGPAARPWAISDNRRHTLSGFGPFVPPAPSQRCCAICSPASAWLPPADMTTTALVARIGDAGAPASRSVGKLAAIWGAAFTVGLAAALAIWGEPMPMAEALAATPATVVGVTESDEASAQVTDETSAPAAVAPTSAEPALAAWPAKPATALVHAKLEAPPAQPVESAARATVELAATTPATCLATIGASRAGVEVIWNGKVLGETPLRAASVPCGDAVVRWRHRRYKTAEKRVTVAAGATLVVSQRMSRPRRWLQLRSTPSGATFRVNGQPVGKSRVAVKAHSIVSVKVSKPGFRSKRMKLRIGDRNRSVSVHLEPSWKSKSKTRRRAGKKGRARTRR